MKKNTLTVSFINKLQLAAIAAVGLAVATPAYANSTYQVQGEKDLEGRCNFTSTLTLPQGQKAVQVNQIGIDAAKCTLTMQRVQPDLTLDAAQTSSANLRSQSVQPEAPPPSSQRLVGPAAVFRTRAFSRTFLVNRFGVFQHHVREGVDYLYDGFRVANAFCLRPSNQLQWRVDFWSLITATSQSCLYNFNFTQVTASTGARYFSPGGFYCGFPTNILYNRHRTIGRANGTILDSTSFGGSSGCLSQIFVRHQIVRVF